MKQSLWSPQEGRQHAYTYYKSRVPKKYFECLSMVFVTFDEKSQGSEQRSIDDLRRISVAFPGLIRESDSDQGAALSRCGAL